MPRLKKKTPARKAVDNGAPTEAGAAVWSFLFYVLPPAMVLVVLMFVWDHTPPPVDDSADVAAAVAAAAQKAKPVKKVTRVVVVENPGEAVVFDSTTADTAEPEEGTPSLLDDDAAGEDILEIPAEPDDDSYDGADDAGDEEEDGEEAPDADEE